MQLVPWPLWRNRIHTALLFLCLGFYALLACALAHTKAPWCDEGWFANPSYNLAFRGNMGTNVLEPSGHFLNAYLSGIGQRTYIVVPNHLVALAGWFRVFGMTAFTARLYSIAWGAVTICLLFFLVRRFFKDLWVAVFAVLFTAVDFIFLWTAADARMEASVCALALGALAAYLYLRERNLVLAVAASQGLAALAMFTHPNALVVLLALYVLAWKLDRQRLRFGHLALGVVPFAVLGAWWWTYIAQSPQDFTAQFLANASGRGAARWKMVLEPWRAVTAEVIRYVSTYSGSNLWSGEMNQWMVIVPCMYFSACVAFFRQWRRHGSDNRNFGVCIATVILALTFLNGFKASMYLASALPFYNAVLAWWVISSWRRGYSARLASAVIGAAFILANVTTTYQHVAADEYGRFYVPTALALQQYDAAGKTVVASAALGFATNFSGFRDDWRLGLYSGLKPDVVILDRSYREFTRRFERDEPLVLRHTAALLTKDYGLVRRYGPFWIFERRTQAAQDGEAMSASFLQPPGERAEYLFKRIESIYNVATEQEFHL